MEGGQPATATEVVQKTCLESGCCLVCALKHPPAKPLPAAGGYRPPANQPSPTSPLTFQTISVQPSLPNQPPTNLARPLKPSPCSQPFQNLYLQPNRFDTPAHPAVGCSSQSLSSEFPQPSRNQLRSTIPSQPALPQPTSPPPAQPLQSNPLTKPPSPAPGPQPPAEPSGSRLQPAPAKLFQPAKLQPSWRHMVGWQGMIGWTRSVDELQLERLGFCWSFVGWFSGRVLWNHM